MSTIQDKRAEKEEEFMSIQDLLQLFAVRWRWFVLSVACAFSIAVLYLMIKQPEYTRSASILVKEDTKTGSLPDMGAISDLGLFQSNIKVQNELITIQSPVIITEVVRRLGLHASYSVSEGLRRRTLYGQDLPLKVKVVDGDPQYGSRFALDLSENGRVLLRDFEAKEVEVAGQVVEGAIGDTLSTPIGRIYLSPLVGAYAPQAGVRVEINRIDDTADRLLKELQASLVDEKASVIKLSYRDVSPRRAEDILATIIQVYNELWLEDKNQVAVSTSRFINERLAVIERDLGLVDNDISSFKSKNLLPDVLSATELYLAKAGEVEGQMLLLSNQLSMAKYVRSHLASPDNKDRLLPANTGIGSDKLEGQISEYNELLIGRNRLLANSSDSNPLVKEMEEALASMRTAIMTALDNVVVSLNTQIANLSRSEQKNTQRIAANPEQAKYLLTVERQQKIKESLYLYLLQKREENELTQSFTAYNTRVITPPTGPRKPTAPLMRNVLLIALALGLIVPAGIIFARESMNSTLRGRKDTEGLLSMPFIGEIPNLRERKPIWQRLRRRRADNHIERPLVVQAGGGDIGNEAFRVVRTNLEFMLQGDSKVVMFCSINPNSGKTFICMNLAVSFALKGKKVLVVDLDMRRALLSLYHLRPKHGIANYLNGDVQSLDSIISRRPESLGVDMLPVGTLPPNPTELLVSERMAELMQELRQRYDYIFIDCPPAEIVADASIINQHVDKTIFVLRVGLLERTMLPEIERFHSENKYRHMVYMLNDVDKISRKYGYNYGYGDYFDRKD